MGPDHAVLLLPPAARDAIETSFPGFEPWPLDSFARHIRSPIPLDYEIHPWQAPFAVIGDFDGNGHVDVVVDGRTEREAVQLCLWSDANGWRAESRFHYPLTEEGEIVERESYLARVPPGVLEIPLFGVDDTVSDSTIWLEHPGYENVASGKGAILSYFDRGQWKKIITAD